MTRLTRFFPHLRDGKTFLIPWRRGAVGPAPAAVATFTHGANARAKAANRARNKAARSSRRANRR